MTVQQQVCARIINMSDEGDVHILIWAITDSPIDIFIK